MGRKTVQVTEWGVELIDKHGDIFDILWCDTKREALKVFGRISEKHDQNLYLLYNDCVQIDLVKERFRYYDDGDLIDRTILELVTLWTKE
ncbi:MAG: hypothetical protein GY813_06225 [Halieaceae bacterium]|nr:hypothetical protein [Halieaceae bacterium]